MENHGQKRSACEQLDLLEGVKTILLDIEGTTTPFTFAKDILFPYVKENVKTYLNGHWENEECKQDVEALRAQATKDKEEGAQEIPTGDADQETMAAAVATNILWQMEQERKSEALSQFQDHMYREAFKMGKIQTQIYEDVVAALDSWKQEDKKVFVFSSENVESQKLMFGYSCKGDLQEKVSGYFDTSVGDKSAKESYAAIAKQVEASTEEVLYLTSRAAEAKAAAEAGFKTCLVVRESNPSLSDEDKQKFNIINSFRELASEVEVPAAKKQEAESTEEQEGEGGDDAGDKEEEEEEEEGEEEEEEAS